MSDEKAEAAIGIDTVHKRRIGKKEIINIDTLSNSFENGDEVTLEALIAKKLVPSKTGSVKLLARGTLNKKLIVFSFQCSVFSERWTLSTPDCIAPSNLLSERRE